MTAEARLRADGSNQKTAADRVVDSMIQAGVGITFGIPGVQNDQLYDSFFRRRDEMRVVHTRHEQGAAYMALGAAMATGLPAVYNVVPGPGFLNTTAALSTALACNAPVVCLTSEIRSDLIGKGSGQLHELPDQLGIMRRLTKHVEHIASPQFASAAVDRAIASSMSGRKGPVGVQCPMDIWGLTATETAEFPPTSTGTSIADVEGALELIEASRRPMIYVGGGALDASDAIRDLARMLHAPVVAHRMGLGVVDARDALAFNHLGGAHLWPHADLVIAVGTKVAPLAQWGLRNVKIIRIDADAEQIKTPFKPDVAICGDARVVVGQIVLQVSRRKTWDGGTLAAVRKSVRDMLAPLVPQTRYLDAIRKALPENGIFVDELTQVGHVSRLLFPVYDPRTYLTPGYQGTLGWGYPTALGAQAVCPHAPVVSITGDGGFLFNVQELATAVQHDIPAVVILFNDKAFGNVRRIQQNDYAGRLIASDLKNPDFVALARSFGADATRVSHCDALGDALSEALRVRRPALIEVEVNEDMPDPWPILRYRP